MEYNFVDGTKGGRKKWSTSAALSRLRKNDERTESEERRSDGRRKEIAAAAATKCVKLHLDDRRRARAQADCICEGRTVEMM